MIKNLITGHSPDICHFPGKSYKKRYSKNIFNLILQNLIEPNIHMDDLCIISIRSTDEESLIEKQLYKTNNFICLKLITSKKWRHIYKLYNITEYIKNCSFKYILFLDAYDVLLNNSGLTNIISDIDTDKIIFNAENNFYNTLDDTIASKIKNCFDDLYCNQHYKYLNTGCFFGKRLVILEYLSTIIRKIENKGSPMYGVSCDQTAIQLDYYLDNNTRNLLTIDTKCKYFMCMNYLSSTDIQVE